MKALAVRNLTKYYGKNKGVENINLEVEAGEVFGFIGPNGSGKSTTIRMLMQLTYPTSGDITLLGTKIARESPELRRRIGYLPSEVNFYKDMTGKQVLDFTAAAYGLELKHTPAAAYCDLLSLDIHKKVKSYSLGNRKKLGIVQSLLHRPELLILDEPTSGLDPLMQHSLFDLLKELNEQGMTIFFSTHVLSEVEKLCHRVGFIRSGQLIQTSKVDEIPGKNRRIVSVQYAEKGNLIEKYGLRAIDPQVTYTGDQHVFAVTARLDEALQAISAHPIADISIRKPSLEELFMDYYHVPGGEAR